MTTLTDDDVLSTANLIDKKYGEIWDFTDSEMVKFARAILAAHTAKLLAEVEMPEEFTVYAEDEPNSVIHGYTADQLQQYAAACAAQARVKALEDTKEVCKNFTVVPELIHLTSVLLMEEIEQLKVKP